MRIDQLSITQFRNHTSSVLSFDGAPVVLFLGENGSGKTSILESVSVLSLTKSCRNAGDSILLQWNQPFYRVSAALKTDDGQMRTVESVYESSPRQQKALFSQDVKVAASEFVGQLPTVTFLPEDLRLFQGPPSLRRQFLDRILCQVSPEYLRTLSFYGRVLKQRNALLKQVSFGNQDEENIAIWDAELAELGAELLLARLSILETFNVTFAAELLSLGLDWSSAQLRYERNGSASTKEAIQEELLCLLAENRSRDIRLQSTTIGPHRDDWTIMIDDHALPDFASRGQERIALIALLFVTVSFLELKRGEKPVILLDDVFSELDTLRQEKLLHCLGSCQVLLTSAHTPPLLNDVQTWQVKDGMVEGAHVMSSVSTSV